MADERQSNVFCARLAEQGERYDDMIKFMTAAVEAGKPLNRQERNLLCVGFRNAVQARRNAYRCLQGELTKFEGDNQQRSKKLNVNEGQLLIDYRTQIEKELDQLCNQVLELYKDHLIALGGKDVESCVHFKKM